MRKQESIDLAGDPRGSKTGFVHWFRRRADATGTTETDDHRVLESLHRSQAVIEFTPAGEILTANQNFLTTVGYDLDEIVGRHHSMFVLPAESADRSYVEFWEALRGGGFQSAEFRRIGKGGRVIWIQATYNPVLDNEGNVYKIIKFATDITEQRKTQQQTQDRTQAVVEFLPDGTVIGANTLFLDTLEVSLDQILGEHHRSLLPPSSGNGQNDELWSAVATGEFRQGQFRCVKGSGQELWLQGVYSPVLGHGGRVVRVTLSAVDITNDVERRREALGVGRSIAGSVVEMTHAIGEISQSMNRTADVAQVVETASVRAAAKVSNLEKASNSISKVTDAITGLSQQTQLLALNATIEAARAGDYGRGFVVVANEVKDLANQTNRAASDIQARIETIQNEISTVVSTIEEIAGSVGDFSEMTASVATAVEEQSTLMAGMNEYAGQLLEHNEADGQAFGS